MTRIRTDSIGLRSGGVSEPTASTGSSYEGLVTPSPEATETAAVVMESSIMDTDTGLPNDASEMVVAVEDVVSSIHQSAVALMNGVAVVASINNNSINSNSNNNNNREDDKRADKSAKRDQRSQIIDDFASNDDDEQQRAVNAIHAHDSSVEMRCYAAAATGGGNVDNGHHSIGMLVDGATVAATEIAIESISETVVDEGQDTETIVGVEEVPDVPFQDSAKQDDDNGDDDDDNDEDSESCNDDTEDKSLQMMQTEEDPLLQETFNALINGTGGIEVVDTSERISPSEEQNITDGAGGGDPVATAGDSGPGEELAESDRNYECTYCGKLFTRSNTLSYHLKVHTGERPFKCKHCAKAFREHYRLVKHLKTHAKHGGCRERDRYRVERREERARMALQAQQASSRLVSSVAVKTTTPMAAAAGSPEEDYTTGDSERFFKTYELADGPEAMKLEPDISLTVEGVSEGAVAAMADVPMLEETVERCEEEEIGVAEEATTQLLAGEGTTDVRYQIIEERIKSLQREVHLVNQNLNRVESKVDGLTRMISLFIGKFEEDPAALGDASSGAVTVAGQTVASVTVDPPLVPSSAATIPHSPAPPSPAAAQPKTTVLLAPNNHQNVQHHQQHPLAVSSAQHPMVYGAGTVLSTISPLPTAVTQPSQPQTLVPERESRSSNNPAQFYHFSTAEQFHPKAQVATVTVKADRSLTPAPAQQTQLALGGGGNQLLDTFPDVPELPIRTVGDFLDLNDHCTDNEQFLLQMMIRLHSEIHNSQPFQRNIKRMMEALVTYEVLCQFSWSGKSAINGQYTKYVFGNSLGIIDLLTKTLNLGKSAKEAEANQKPIFAAIQSFIKHSRQNMIRDSRKRRDPIGRSSLVGATMATASAVADSTTSTGSYLVTPTHSGDCPPDRNLLIKQIKSEFQHHAHPEELVNPF